MQTKFIWMLACLMGPNSAVATDLPLVRDLPIESSLRVLYSSEREAGTLSLFSLDVGGSDRRQHVSVAVQGRGEYEPSVSPDRQTIAFTTYRYGGWKIAVADIDGLNVRRLTMDPQYAYDASWSPDGKRLVYRRIVNHGGAYFRGNGDIFVIDADGTNNRNLSNDDTEHARNPSFSPDGRHVIYDAFVGEQLHIVRMRSDGSQKQRLPGGGSHAFAPSWSPDGKWIAHMRQDDSGYTDLWRMRGDGSAAENLTQSATRKLRPTGDEIQHWQYGTHWSPDGKMIAFTANYAESDNIDIYIWLIEDVTLARLTMHAGADTHSFWYMPDQ